MIQNTRIDGKSRDWWDPTRRLIAYQPKREAPRSRVHELPKWMFFDLVHSHCWKTNEEWWLWLFWSLKLLSALSCDQWAHHAGCGRCHRRQSDRKMASSWNHWSCRSGWILSGVLRRRKWDNLRSSKGPYRLFDFGLLQGEKCGEILGRNSKQLILRHTMAHIH